MQKVTAKRSVSKFAIIANLSSNLRDTSQKHTVNTSFDTHSTIQNNKVSLAWRHLETLWRHFTNQQSSAKCFQNSILDFAAIVIWRHLAFQITSKSLTSQPVNFEVSLSVSRGTNLSLLNVSEVSLNLMKFCQVSPEQEVTVWQS